MDQDAEHLRILSIFHYVVGGLLACFACFFIIYIVVGLVMASAPTTLNGHGAPPRFVGWFMAMIGCFFLFLGWSLAALIIYAGRCLAQRKHYRFCMIIAGVSCMFMPFGTVLGIFTILVLQRERVKGMFHPVPTVA
ncbi:MAG: hypothetical protein JWQ71_4574 [Pedosphaera sp.]|nr:hypothetical protein [Pedosphaera sp.]